MARLSSIRDDAFVAEEIRDVVQIVREIALQAQKNVVQRKG
jgi:hypothetical protein